LALGVPNPAPCAELAACSDRTKAQSTEHMSRARATEQRATTRITRCRGPVLVLVGHWLLLSCVCVVCCVLLTCIAYCLLTSARKAAIPGYVVVARLQQI
jgi:hypothetical protein